MSSLLRQAMKNPTLRRAYLAKNLYRYCRRYFSNYYTFPTPEFLIPVYKALEEGKNVFFEAFRYSAKTTLAQMYLNNVVAQKKRRHIMWYSETGEGSTDNLMYVANTFIENERFIRDYGHLYYDEDPKKFKSKTIKGKSKYITENEVLLVGMSLGTSPRGKNYTATDGKYRPDLLVFDDIDTSKSARNKSMIDKNREFLTQEVFGGITPSTQIVVLGNTIYDDGLVPRLRKHFENDPDWLIVRQPIYDENGKIVRQRFVETNEEAAILNAGVTNPHRMYVSLEKERERLGTISFGQNYLLEPYIRGMVIVPAYLIKRENLDGYYFQKIRIGLDTAISKKQESDRVAFTVTGYDGDKRYVLESLKLEGLAKRMPNQITLAKELYGKRAPHCDSIALNVETVAFQEVLADYLKEEGMAVNPIKTSNDKTTRMIERQGLFESGKVIFNTTGCESLIDNIVHFPNVEYDDEADSFLLSLEDDKRQIIV